MPATVPPPPAPTASAGSPLWHEPAAGVRSRLALRGRPDRLLLARVLQRLSVPEVELHAVRYVAAGPAADSRIEAEFTATAARARLIGRRLAQLPGVGQVAIAPAGDAI